jgi:hypothetical protein
MREPRATVRKRRLVLANLRTLQDLRGAARATAKSSRISATPLVAALDVSRFSDHARRIAFPLDQSQPRLIQLASRFRRSDVSRVPPSIAEAWGATTPPDLILMIVRNTSRSH